VIEISLIELYLILRIISAWIIFCCQGKFCLGSLIKCLLINPEWLILSSVIAKIPHKDKSIGDSCPKCGGTGVRHISLSKFKSTSMPCWCRDGFQEEIGK
jgi:hypothetical protein